MGCIRCRTNDGVNQTIAHMTVEACGRGTCAAPQDHHEYLEEPTLETALGAAVTHDEMVSIVIGEILMDMVRGTVPWTVDSYSKLHDYVDANCYGSMCETSVWRWPLDEASEEEQDRARDARTSFINAVDDEVDQWLRERT